MRLDRGGDRGATTGRWRRTATTAASTADAGIAANAGGAGARRHHVRRRRRKDAGDGQQAYGMRVFERIGKLIHANPSGEGEGSGRRKRPLALPRS